MTLPTPDNGYQLQTTPPTAWTVELWNAVFGSIASRLDAREALEASFELLQSQGVQAALDYIQVTVAPQLSTLQDEILAARIAIDNIINEGTAPNSEKLGGELPGFYATASALSEGLDSLQSAIDNIINEGTAPNSEKLGGELPGFYATASALSEGLDSLQSAIDDVVGGAPSDLDTLGKIAQSLDTKADADETAESLGEKASKAGDTFTGLVTAPSISVLSGTSAGIALGDRSANEPSWHAYALDGEFRIGANGIGDIVQWGKSKAMTIWGAFTTEGDITTKGASISVGQGLTGVENSHVWFRDTVDGVNYPFYYERSAGRFNVAGRNGVAGPIMVVDGSGYARYANVFRSENTGGRLFLNMPNQLELHWNNGFYYRVDGNAWVLINSSASDQSFKTRVNFSGHIFDEIKKVGVVRYTPKDGIPVAMPEGERDGFYAQELAQLDPNLVEEMPFPFEREYEKDEAGNLVRDEDGNTIPLPHELDGKTFLALAPDAQIQLIAKLWRAVRELIERSEAREDGVPIIDEAKEQTLDDIKDAAVHKIRTEHARFLRQLTGGATIEERDTWQTKAIASEAYIAGTASPIQTAMLTSEASMTGESVASLAATVMAKYAAYHELIGLASGAKRKAEAAINAASTAQEVAAVLQQTDAETKAMAAKWLAQAQ